MNVQKEISTLEKQLSDLRAKAAAAMGDAAVKIGEQISALVALLDVKRQRLAKEQAEAARIARERAEAEAKAQAEADRAALLQWVDDTQTAWDTATANAERAIDVLRAELVNMKRLSATPEGYSTRLMDMGNPGPMLRISTRLREISQLLGPYVRF